MKYDVSTLEGALLDAAVAMAEGQPTDDINPGTPRIPLSYSTNWEYGGPIIDREWISTVYEEKPGWSGWTASLLELDDLRPVIATGPTPLIAAMRAYVASKLGETVELP